MTILQMSAQCPTMTPTTTNRQAAPSKKCGATRNVWSSSPCLCCPWPSFGAAGEKTNSVFTVERSQVLTWSHCLWLSWSSVFIFISECFSWWTTVTQEGNQYLTYTRRHHQGDRPLTCWRTLCSKLLGLKYKSRSDKNCSSSNGQTGASASQSDGFYCENKDVWSQTVLVFMINVYCAATLSDRLVAWQVARSVASPAHFSPHLF